MEVPYFRVEDAQRRRVSSRGGEGGRSIEVVVGSGGRDEEKHMKECQSRFLLFKVCVRWGQRFISVARTQAMDSDVNIKTSWNTGERVKMSTDVL